MRVDVGASSDVGRLRTVNEDSFVVDDRLALYAVADGMGGHRAGEVASATALEALRAAVAGGKALDAAIELANSAVFDKAATDRELSGMGTTLTAVAIVGDATLLIGHVGDSRAYRVRDGAITQVTDDHSLVEELVREGRISPEEAKVHPRRAVVTRAIGIDSDVEVDLYTVDARTGDRLLICSDGLSGMLDDDEMLRLSLTETDPRLAADRLVDAANEAGGEDNITVVVVDVLDAPPPSAPDPEALATSSLPRTPVPVAAPDVPDSIIPDATPRRSRSRRVGGVLLFVLPVVVIIGIAVGAVDWYAHHTYYVGFKGDQVVVFKGVPGGILGWKPTVDQTTDLRRSKLTPDAVDQIHNSGKGSLDHAQAFISNLEAATTTTTTTTTTVAPTTTTRPKTTATTAKLGTP